MKRAIKDLEKEGEDGPNSALLNELRLKRFSDKSWRRSLATNLAAAGASDSFIMRVGRWKDLETMLRYLESFRPLHAQFNMADSARAADAAPDRQSRRRRNKPKLVWNGHSGWQRSPGVFL